MSILKTYDLFISHAWRHNDAYYKLVNLLNHKDFFKWRNYSVPKHDPVLDPNSLHGKRSLTASLERQVRPVNCVIILAGMYAAHREWIQKEIDLAQAYNKPIIAIRPQGAERMPTVVTDAAWEVVNWNTDSIVAAIRKHSL